MKTANEKSLGLKKKKEVSQGPEKAACRSVSRKTGKSRGKIALPTASLGGKTISEKVRQGNVGKTKRSVWKGFPVGPRMKLTPLEMGGLQRNKHVKKRKGAGPISWGKSYSKSKRTLRKGVG